MAGPNRPACSYSPRPGIEIQEEVCPNWLHLKGLSLGGLSLCPRNQNMFSL